MPRRLLLAVSTPEALRPVLPALERHCETVVFDHQISLGPTFRDDCVYFHHEGVERAGSSFDYLFFYPDSVENFLSPPPAANSSELQRRSSVAYRIALCHFLNTRFSPSMVVGNTPAAAVLAANRILFFQMRQGRSPTTWEVCPTRPRGKVSEDHEEVFRFLPDTHIKENGRVTAPFLFDRDLVPAIQAAGLPYFIERYQRKRFDVRVYSMGAESIGFYWPRDAAGQTVDIRTVPGELGEQTLELREHRELTDCVDFYRNSFAIEFFCLDFVSDLEGDGFFPVDLNIAPTWSWLSAKCAALVEQGWERYLDASQCFRNL